MNNVSGYIVNECITLCLHCFSKLNFEENNSTVIFKDHETQVIQSCESCNDEIETIVL